jgi:uncharacterized protein YjbJ (UPF0337 family)
MTTTPDTTTPEVTTPDVSDRLPGGYPGTPQHEQPVDENAAAKELDEYVQKIKDSLPSFPLKLRADNNDDKAESKDNTTDYKEPRSTDNDTENKDSVGYVEKIKESLPSFPLMSNADNNVAENSSENKDSRTYVEKFKDSLPSFSLMSNAENNVAEDNESKNNAENKESGNNAENKESRNNAENNIENAENNAENAKKIRDDKIREDFPLRYEPNPSLKATDDNNLANVTNQGSSALGGVGVNPAAILGLRSESPRHPYYRDHPPEAEHAHSTADQHEIPFDLTGDYNKQKEQEQMAGHKAKSAQEQDKQKSEGKKRAAKPERLDLGVKPLGDQQPPPLPYKPEEDRDRVKQPPGKNTVVHSDRDIGDIPRITKKDRVNATVGKAVGTLKQKIGKIVRSDSLTTKGTEEKAEAQKTKEFAELQKQAKEF